MATKPKIEIDEARWAEVQKRALSSGGHDNFAKGVSAMEAVAYITREPWGDQPDCVSPVIGAFMRSWNDSLSDADRSILIPLIPLTVGTRGSAALDERRSMMAIDWYIREHVPAFLRLAGMTKQADTLAGLSELTAQAQMDGIRVPLEAIRDDASAAWSAAESALDQTRKGLQLSAVDLLKRMCALTDADLAA